MKKNIWLVSAHCLPLIVVDYRNCSSNVEREPLLVLLLLLLLTIYVRTGSTMTFYSVHNKHKTSSLRHHGHFSNNSLALFREKSHQAQLILSMINAGPVKLPGTIEVGVCFARHRGKFSEIKSTSNDIGRQAANKTSLSLANNGARTCAGLIALFQAY